MKINSLSMKDFSNNSKILLLSQPLWAIPFFLYYSYSTLYMMNFGLSATQIGFINGFSFVFKGIFSLFSGIIVDKLGRKTSLVLFDIISWLIPIILWTIGGSFTVFIIAGFINSFVIVNSISSQMFLIEDISPRVRIETFNWFELIALLSGLFVPIAGLLILHLELVNALRIIYIFAFICMLFNIMLKWTKLSETNIGLNQKTQCFTFISSLKRIKKAVIYILSEKKLKLIILINITNLSNNQLLAVYLFAFYSKKFLLSDSYLSFIPFVSSVVAILFLVLIKKSFEKTNSYIEYSLLLNILGCIIILTISYINNLDITIIILSIILNTITWSIAKSFLAPLLRSSIANAINDNMRSNVSAIYNSLTHFLSFFVVFLGGILFDKNPILIIVLITTLQFFNLIFIKIIKKLSLIQRSRYEV